MANTHRTSTNHRSDRLAASDIRLINEQSAAQHGVISPRQLRNAGISRSTRQHLITSHRFELLANGVLHASGAPSTPLTNAMAAVVAAGETAMVSHSSAAALWNLPGFTLEPLHLTVLRCNNPISSQLATVHRQRSLARVKAARVDGLPVVRPEVLIIQLCGIVHPSRAGRLLDRAWSERLLSGRSLRRVLASIDTKGLNGVGVVRRLLRERGDDYVPPASGLEARVVQILQDVGLAAMDRQVDLGDDHHWCGRVDFVDLAAKVVLEVNSEKYHSALTDVQHDLARAALLEAAGFTVGSVTDFQVWHRPREVIATVRKLRAIGLTRRTS